MATTTNYGWTTPNDTDLVKDGAAAIRTLGSSVDTTTKALNPSTTLGDVEYRSATADTNTRLPIGTTGQVLAVSGGVPAWTTPSSGSLTLIQNIALSGSTITFSSIPQTYTNLYLVVKNYTNTSNGTVLFMRYNGDTATNYEWRAYVTAANVSWSYTSFSLMENNIKNTDAKNFIWHNIADYTNSNTYKLGNGVGVAQASDNANQFQFQPLTTIYKDTTAITSLTVFPNTGTMNGGNAYLYGVK